MPNDPELEGFELFDQSAIAPPKAPFVTIQREGLFSLNASAFEALGQPKAVLLYYKQDEKTIAIVKSEGTLPQSKTVRPQGRNSKTWMFSGRLFTKHYKIDTTTARRYAAVSRKGRLIVDMRAGGADATGVRARIKRDVLTARSL